jgi:hypothetical protein
MDEIDKYDNKPLGGANDETESKFVYRIKNVIALMAIAVL